MTCNSPVCWGFPLHPLNHANSPPAPCCEDRFIRQNFAVDELTSVPQPKSAAARVPSGDFVPHRSRRSAQPFAADSRVAFKACGPPPPAATPGIVSGKADLLFSPGRVLVYKRQGLISLLLSERLSGLWAGVVGGLCSRREVVTKAAQYGDRFSFGVKMETPEKHTIQCFAQTGSPGLGALHCASCSS